MTAQIEHARPEGRTNTRENYNINVETAIHRAFANKEAWDRSDYIGASEIAGCPLKIYYDKTEPTDFKGNGKTERGHAIEVALIQLLKQGGMDIRYHAGHINHQKEFRHPDYPVAVHPDGIVYQRSKPFAVLEVKSVGSDYFRTIKEPLQSWVVQTRFNAYMANLPKALLVAVNASDLEDVKWWEFEAMSEAEAKEYLEKAKRIMAAIELGAEPFAEPSQERCKWCEHKSKCANVWIPDEEQKQKEIETDEARDALEALKEAQELKNKAKDLESFAKAKILSIAKEHEAGKIKSGHLMAILEPRKGRVSIDTKKLFAEHPEIDKSKYEKTGAPSVAIKLKETA